VYLAVLALDGYQNHQVAGHVGLEDLQIRLAVAAEILGKRLNGLGPWRQIHAGAPRQTAPSARSHQRGGSA
jgi:hypothetical protein